jgi:hypothetical protein
VKGSFQEERKEEMASFFWKEYTPSDLKSYYVKNGKKVA